MAEFTRADIENIIRDFFATQGSAIETDGEVTEIDSIDDAVTLPGVKTVNGSIQYVKAPMSLFVGPQGETGTQGDKGDPFTYEDMTAAQKQEIATFAQKTEYESSVLVGEYKYYNGSTLSDSVTGRVLLPGKHYEIDAVQTVDNTDYGLTFFLPIVADDGTPYLEGYDPQTDDEIHNVQEWFFTFNAASNANGITFRLGAKDSSVKVNSAAIEAGKTYEVTIVYNKKRNEYYVVQFGFSEN